MRTINSSFSHINILRKKNRHEDKEWAKAIPLDEILRSEPMQIETYDKLVNAVAQIQHRNRNFVLYYRGQNTEYKSNSKTTLNPSIYRKQDGEQLMLKDKFEILNKKVNGLQKLFAVQPEKLAGTPMINKYPEIAWSILQHYMVCETPLLDLTTSLHVACSFAFDKNDGETGILYVIGMPWQTDSIGYNAYEELVNIRLLSVCPPQAKRPFFQDGYLAGPFPHYKLDDPGRAYQFDFARRLIAKFQITESSTFWGEGFNAIPHNKLYQVNDKVKMICDGLVSPK